MPRDVNVSAKVYEALRLYTNQEVTYNELAGETGLTVHQITQAIRRLKHQRKLNIETVLPRVSVRYNGPKPASTPEPPKPTAPLFEFIGQRKSGAYILRDESGTLYEAVEFE